MRIIKLAAALLSLAAATTISAQIKANYKEADRYLVSHMWGVVPDRDVKPQPTNNGDSFWFTFSTCKSKGIFLCDPSKGKLQPLFDNSRMAIQLSAITGKTYIPDSLKVYPHFDKNGKTFTFDIDGHRISYDMATQECSELPRLKREPFKPKPVKERMAHYSADSAFIVYCKGHDIYLEHRDGSVIRLTNDGKPLFSYSDDERSSDSTLFSTRATWIGKTHKLYVMREDNRRVGTLPVVTSVGGKPKLATIASGRQEYAMPGDKYVTQYELSIIDADLGKTMKIKLGKWQDQKLHLWHVSDDGRYLYVQRTRRTCDEMDLCKVDTRTGQVKTILNEVCKPYFSDRMQSMTFVNGGKDFIWWSERTGWGHFYLYSSDGQFKGSLTTGNWMAERIVRVDSLTQTVYFIGHGREKGFNPYYSLLYSVNLKKPGRVRLLTPEEAEHSISFLPSGRYFVDNYSRVDLCPVSVLRDSRGRMVCQLAKADLSRLFAMGWKMPERFTVKAADGKTDLYGVMWKPFQMDSTKRYPIISYVYPGPQQEAVPLAFTTTGDHNAALAQVGFIVVGFGHRGGSPLRDKAYRTYGYGNLRDYPIADDHVALQQISRRYSFIDSTKVGIFGHSGGGFMSATALMTYPDFYKAAVASSGNYDNNIFHLEWAETFHGVTQRVKGNDTIFTCRVPTTMELVSGLKGHLLLVTGDEDTNVHPANTLRLANALIQANKKFELLVLPGQGHLYRSAASDYWRRSIWFHFAKYLLGDDSADFFTGMEDYK